MHTYVIGDLQGCFTTLEALLAKINFRRQRDRLWFVGDLVNRGSGSLECLRFVRDLGHGARTVLGNHDLHLLAVAEGIAKLRSLDTLDALLKAPDREALLHWLRHRPLLHVDGRFAMVHAGLMPQWSWQQAHKLAREVETALRGSHYRKVLVGMYGDEPTAWRESLAGMARMRFVLNTLTRLRTLTSTGEQSLRYKAGLAEMPRELHAWFQVPTVRRADRVLFAGHWSALGFHEQEQIVMLDTGCVWGGALTAVRLSDGKRFEQRSCEVAATLNPLSLRSRANIT